MQQPNSQVLIVEDDERLAELTRDYLQANGFDVAVEGDGAKAAARIVAEQPDLVILDLMLPGLDGLQVCRLLRADSAGLPILMLTARDDSHDQVLGLEMGADDYLAKPFALSELLARVLALGRRSGHAQAETVGQNVLRIEGLELDLLRRRATRDGVRLDLTAKEFTLLALLMRKQGEVLSRLELAEQVWDINFNSNTNVVEVAIRRLRGKVDEPFDKKLLHTVRGMGYVLEPRSD